MSLKSRLFEQYAKVSSFYVKKWAAQPVKSQKKVFDYLIRKAKNTQFGKEHDFAGISSLESPFQSLIMKV